MKFNCGMAPEEKAAAREELARKTAAYAFKWHDYFAWLPTRVGSGDCRWLETVERRFPLFLATERGDPVYYHTWIGANVAGWGQVEYRPKQAASSRRSGDE